MWLERISVLVCLVSVSPRQCDFPSDWVGAWHHLGYDQPINVTRHHIEQKVGGDTSPALVRCTSLKLEKNTMTLSFQTQNLILYG